MVDAWGLKKGMKASNVPLFGLLGLVFLAASLGLKTIRSISQKHIAD
jgi:hypothetical protein